MNLTDTPQLALAAVNLDPLTIGFGIIGLMALFVFFMIWNAFQLWMQSILSNAPVGLVSIVLMRFRKVDANIIVTARITAKKAGIDISTDKLEGHYMARGHVVVEGLRIRVQSGNNRIQEIVSDTD